MDSKSTIAGLIIGATTGVALGLLFAPKKGSETRDDIARTSNEYFDKVSNELKNQFEDKLDGILKQSSDRAERRAKRQIEEVKREIAQIKTNN